MKDALSIEKLLELLILCMVCISFGFIVGRNSVHCDKHYIEINDTIYDTTILDSIQYNIIVRDSIIYNLKQEMTNEIKESYSLTDSACIKLYEQLLKE